MAIPSGPKMQRQMITLTTPQKAMVREEAHRLGISMADMIRRIIDEWRENRELRRAGGPRPEAR